MKKMAKVTALGLTAALSVGMLAGCGDGGSGDNGGKESGKTTLTFGIWDENQRPAMEQLAEAYEAENEDVTVEVQLTPYKGGRILDKAGSICDRRHSSGCVLAERAAPGCICGGRNPGRYDRCDRRI